jgi:hypothetical protein
LWLQLSYATNEYETNRIGKYAKRVAKTSEVSAGNGKRL